MKKAAALFLSVIMILIMVSCGKEQDAESLKNRKEEVVYVPEYITADNEEDYCSYNNISLLGDSLYYVKYSWEEETNISASKIKMYSLKDGSIKQIPVELDEKQYIYHMVADSKNNLYLLLNADLNEAEAIENPHLQTQMILKKCDGDGTVLLERQLTDMLMKDDEQLWIQSMAVDGEDNLYFVSEGAIYLMDSAGAEAGMITLDNGWVNEIITDKEGKIYAVYDENAMKEGTVLGEINFSGKKIKTVYENFPSNSPKSIAVGEKNVFWVNDGASVYQYDLKTEEYEKMFDWQGSNINGNSVDEMAVTEDGELYASLNDFTNGECGIVKLNKTKVSELSPKEEIIFSTMEPNEAIEAAAVAFNNQSNKYHVTVRTYIDPYHWTPENYKDGLVRFYNDISSGENRSDILDVSPMNERLLIEKNIFEDLYPYMGQSTILDKEDFLDGILDAVSYDGKLYFIPKSFVLSSIVGKTSIVGEQMGWTLEEMKKCATEHPDAFLFDALRKDEAMYYCMAFNQNGFIDWSKGECYFDTEEFKHLLEFVNLFPNEVDWENHSSDEGEWVRRLQNDEILLRQVSISSVEDIQLIEAQYGEGVTYIGFPCMDEGVGCMLNAGGRYGINTLSEHKEGAWAFLEYYLTMDMEHDIYFWGFSTLQEKFQKQMEEATSGAQMNALETEGWEYTFHVPGDKDIKQLNELIAVARPAVTTEDEIIRIIQEEAEPYFQGQKTVDEAAKIIQGRLQTYVSENS